MPDARIRSLYCANSHPKLKEKLVFSLFRGNGCGDKCTLSPAANDFLTMLLVSYSGKEVIFRLSTAFANLGNCD
jgi:hypothetical protein